MMSDWHDAARDLRNDVCAHGGFLTIQREQLRDRFGIGRLTQNNSEDLLELLDKHRLFIFPHPYNDQGATLRVYDIESEIGKIAQAVAEPHRATERALADAVHLQERAVAGKHRRSVCVPWLSAFEVYLQLIDGKPLDHWEDLDDDRQPVQLLIDLAALLGLKPEVDSIARHLARAVRACRPSVPRWDDGPLPLPMILKEVERKQQFICDGLLQDAAKHLLERGTIPVCEIDLGRLGLRYRREA